MSKSFHQSYPPNATKSNHIKPKVEKPLLKKWHTRLLLTLYIWVLQNYLKSFVTNSNQKLPQVEVKTV